MTHGKAVRRQVRAICRSLNAHNELRARATDYALRAWIDEPINRSPAAVAAGAVYLASLFEPPKYTQAQVAEASEVTTGTIRETYREIGVHLGVLSGESSEESVVCPRCEDGELTHAEPRWWLPFDHAYRCPACSWEGFGPAPDEVDEPELTPLSRLMAWTWQQTVGRLREGSA